MKGLYGNDGISPTGKATTAPIILLVLGLFFFISPLLLGSGHRYADAATSSGPTFGQAAAGNSTTPAAAAPAKTVAWSDTPTEPGWAPSDPFLDKLKSISGTLIFICLLAIVSLKLLQGKLPMMVGARKSGPPMKVLGRQGLTSNVQMLIVQVGSKNLVLSVSERGAQTLCELSNEELEIPAPPPVVVNEGTSVEAKPSPGEVYGRIFKQYLGIVPGLGSKQ